MHFLSSDSTIQVEVIFTEALLPGLDTRLLHTQQPNPPELKWKEIITIAWHDTENKWDPTMGAIAWSLPWKGIVMLCALSEAQTYLPKSSNLSNFCHIQASQKFHSQAAFFAKVSVLSLISNNPPLCRVFKVLNLNFRFKF